MDIRQVMGAFLTFSMFAMLGNMIKRDHFDGDVLLDVQMSSNVQVDHGGKLMSRHSLTQLPNGSSSTNGQQLKLCYNGSLESKQSIDGKGRVTFSLTYGPEYHISQIANAVMVAKHLGAILVLPEIIGGNEEIRDFGDIYDAERFISRMSSVVQVEKRKHPETFTERLPSVRVPYNANEYYILTRVKPLFFATQRVRVVTYFPSQFMKLRRVDKDMSPYACWAIFEALHLKPKLQQTVDSIVGRLRSHKPDGKLVAIDYKAEMLKTGTCQDEPNKGMKNCYNPVEIAQFLRKIGHPRNSTLYVTHPKTDQNLRPLKDLYPNTFTKEDVMQEEKGVALESKLEQEIVDFHLCSVSDVFVPAKSGLFYSHVVGKRIASGKTDVLVPAQITSKLAKDHVSSYISKRSHPAYACFCK